MFLPYFFRHFLLCTACHQQERTRRRETEEEIFYFFFLWLPHGPGDVVEGLKLEADWQRDQKRPGKERKKPRKVFRPKYTYRPKHTEIHRNGQNTPKHPKILSEVEWEGVSYRFAYWYEIFRPFRPEQNGIYNYALTSKFHLNYNHTPICMEITKLPLLFTTITKSPQPFIRITIMPHLL